MALLARCCPPPYRALAPLLYRDVVMHLQAKVVSDVGARRQRCVRAYSSIGTECVLLFATIVCYCCATVPILTGDDSLQLPTSADGGADGSRCCVWGNCGHLVNAYVPASSPSYTAYFLCCLWGLHVFLHAGCPCRT